ncbi:MAG: hypothetical protein ABI839_02305 [Verrucomicrobiota bacterium]
MKLLILLSLTLAASVALAEESSRPPIQLKHQSSFDFEQGSRNPFWPIGWKPSAKAGQNGAAPAGPVIPASAFLVSSITLDPGAKFAIINGKTMSEGQQFGLQLGGQIHQVTVKAIQDGRVVLLQNGEETAIPLRRR